MNSQKTSRYCSSKHPSHMRGEQQQVTGQGTSSSPRPTYPATDDPSTWRTYWRAQDQPWRKEPEISETRQVELEQRRTIVADVVKGIYLFRGVKLSRADVEWLLAEHDAGSGPVDWNDEQDRERKGLDLRGADLCQVDLRDLPLTRLCGGLTRDELLEATEEQKTMAAVMMVRARLYQAQLEGANLIGAQLEGANLIGAQLEGANLIEAQLEGAHLYQAQLEGAHLYQAQLEGADLSEAQLEGADLSRAQLKGAILRGVQLEGAHLYQAQLEKANLSRAQLRGAHLYQAQLRGAHLYQAQLEGADLSGAQLGGADLYQAQLEGAHLYQAQLEGADLSGARLKGAYLSQAVLERTYLRKAQLEGADLSGARLKGADLTNVTLNDKQSIGPRLADAQWGDTNLAVVNWAQITKLGDEWEAQQKITDNGEKKEKAQHLDEYRAAVRANRQLAIALQAQGLNEEAARFAYRAQICQRAVLRLQGWHSWGKWLGSWFLALLAGYGYRPGRSLLWYFIMIISFSVGYYAVTHFLHAQPYPLAWYEALILSISSFHGRGFFQPVQNLGDPVAILASIEAIIGLVIEISFIATFTQRYFGK